MMQKLSNAHDKLYERKIANYTEELDRILDEIALVESDVTV